MSDYAALRELYYEALQMIPPEGGARSAAEGGTGRSGAEGGAQRGERKMSEALRRDIEMYRKGNPDPKAEPALMQARTQAEWHKAQQKLVLSETPPEQLALAQGVSEGVEASKQQGEKMAEARQKEAADRVATAKRELEEMRRGEFPAGGIGRSGLPPASTPGTVPAPVQGQIPPVEPTHQEAHQQAAAAHRQAAATHEGNPHKDNPVGDDTAAKAHQEQAARHEVDAQGTPNAPGATASQADRDKAEGKPGKK